MHDKTVNRDRECAANYCQPGQHFFTMRAALAAPAGVTSIPFILFGAKAPSNLVRFTPCRGARRPVG